MLGYEPYQFISRGIPRYFTLRIFAVLPSRRSLIQPFTSLKTRQVHNGQNGLQYRQVYEYLKYLAWLFGL